MAIFGSIFQCWAAGFRKGRAEKAEEKKSPAAETFPVSPRALVRGVHCGGRARRSSPAHPAIRGTTGKGEETDPFSPAPRFRRQRREGPAIQKVRRAWADPIAAGADPGEYRGQGGLPEPLGPITGPCTSPCGAAPLSEKPLSGFRARGRPSGGHGAPVGGSLSSRHSTCNFLGIFGGLGELLDKPSETASAKKWRLLSALGGGEGKGKSPSRFRLV